MNSSSHNKINVCKMMKAFMSLKPIFFDTETTGIGNTDQVIELTIIDFDGTVLFDNLMKPTCPISQGAQATHGINMEQLQDQPGFSYYFSTIQKLFAGRFVCGYNVDYDIRMLHQTAGVQDHPKNFLNFMGVFDVMLPYAHFYGDISSFGTPKWQKLGAACQQMNIVPDGALHRSRADTDLTRRLALRMAELALPQVAEVEME